MPSAWFGLPPPLRGRGGAALEGGLLALLCCLPCFGLNQLGEMWSMALPGLVALQSLMGLIQKLKQNV